MGPKPLLGRTFNMNKKYKLYETEAEWNAKNTEIEAALGNNIPYAFISTVQNPESDDHGKFIMPVLILGSDITTSFFDMSETTPWGDEWDMTP